jgi:hypothetical protein
LRLSRSRKRSTLAHPKLSASNLIGTKNDTTFNGCYSADTSTQAAESDLQRDRRCNAPESCAGRLQKLAQGWVGSANPVQAAGRSGGVLHFRPPGAKRRKRLLFGPRSQKGPVDCVHQCRCLLLSSQERPSLQAPLRRCHLTLRHRRLTRSRRDRSRYPGQRNRQWSTTRHRAVTLKKYRHLVAPLPCPLPAAVSWIQTSRCANREPWYRC